MPQFSDEKVKLGHHSRFREDGSLLARDGNGRVLLADDGHTLNFDQHSRLREI